MKSKNTNLGLGVPEIQSAAEKIQMLDEFKNVEVVARLKFSRKWVKRFMRDQNLPEKISSPKINQVQFNESGHMQIEEVFDSSSESQVNFTVSNKNLPL